MWMNRLKLSRVTALVLLAYLTFSFAAGVFLADGTVHPIRRPLLPKDEMQGQRIAHAHQSDLSDALITASDGAILKGWRFRSHNSNGKAVILLHGLSDNRLGMVGYAEMLLDHGFSVLMPDARAHGASGGQLATYGLLESEDIRHWVDWLQQNEHPACTFGFGESMGAAQLLQSLQAEPHFCAVAAESAFSTFREIAYDRVGQFFRTGPWLGRTLLRPVVEVAFSYAKWKYKMDFEQTSPEAKVAATKIPVLLIHGQIDSNIPIRHSRRIAAKHPSVSLWEVANANHCGAISTLRRELEQRLTHWFDGHSDTDHLKQNLPRRSTKLLG
ncbi:MAG: hypothetical protein DMG96_32605 [Acidobacteria bacterium]|nr:MAG: hypothetical protein DMG96_32605 [Acidobacteriota bacterium]